MVFVGVYCYWGLWAKFYYEKTMNAKAVWLDL